MTLLRKILALLDRRERWQGVGIFAAVLVMAFVEVAGVLSIMPFMALVAQPERVLATEWGGRLYALGGFESTNAFLFAAGVVVLIAITFANALAAVTSWAMLRYGWRVHHDMAVRMLGRYLHQPYEFYLSRNTADLSKNILQEINLVVQGVIIPGMQAIARAIVSLAIFVLLFLVDPALAATMVAVLGGAYGLIYLLLRKGQARLGRERVNASRAMYTIAAEAFGGIKDVKILGREEAFLERFSTPSKQHSRQRALNATIGQVPRHLLETVAFGGMLVITLYLIAVRQDLGAVIPIISLYALAGYRLMPSLQQVFHGLTQVRFNMAALDDLHGDWTADAGGRVSSAPSPRPAPAASATNDGVELRDVWYRYPGAEDFALRGIALSVPAKQTVALVGETGSGKTTIADLVLGLLQPASGDVLVNGESADAALVDRNRGIGYVPQQIFLCDDTVANNIAFGVPPERVDRVAVARAARIANLADFIAELPAGYDTVIGERGVRLSGGQRQRIGIARALYNDPAVLVLDEATSALDGYTETGVMEAIHGLSRQKTMIIIAHRISTIQDVDLIYVIRKGTVIAQGTYHELLRTCAEFRAMAKVGSATMAVERI